MFQHFVLENDHRFTVIRTSDVMYSLRSSGMKVVHSRAEGEHHILTELEKKHLLLRRGSLDCC
jgi:hypothetical protein